MASKPVEFALGAVVPGYVTTRTVLGVGGELLGNAQLKNKSPKYNRDTDPRRTKIFKEDAFLIFAAVVTDPFSVAFLVLANSLEEQQRLMEQWSTVPIDSVPFMAIGIAAFTICRTISGYYASEMFGDERRRKIPSSQRKQKR